MSWRLSAVCHLCNYTPGEDDGGFNMQAVLEEVHPYR